MKLYKITLICFSCAVLFMLGSCTKDFEQINENPHGFTTASTGSLFNNVISTLHPGWNEQFYINNEIFYKETQLAALTQDAWGNYEIGTEEIWKNYTGSLAEIRELEKRFSEMEPSAEVANMQAMLKIIVAYKVFKVTDIFGDIPFSEAGYGFQSFESLHPKFDSQESIYKKLLNDLKWADENINDKAVDEPFQTFQSYDKLFFGDLQNWRKFANSLRLRYAMRMADRDREFAAPIIKEIIEEAKPIFRGYDFNVEKLESACLWPNIVGFSNASVDWSFREHKGLRMGSNVWHYLSSGDELDGSGIFDPRAYFFFEGNNAGEWVAYPQIPSNDTPFAGGVPYGSHRDNAGAFDIKGATCIYSPFSYFLVRDANTMPIILITGAEVHFIVAEAYMRGIGVSQDMAQADIEYMHGVNSSVKWWMQRANNVQLPSSGLQFSDKVTVPPNLNEASVLQVFGSWMASSDEEKLEFLYAQRWLDAFRQPGEAYALARRTGKTPREGDPISHFRMPYPRSEVEYNFDNCSEAIARQGGDSPDVKLWWIPDFW